MGLFLEPLTTILGVALPPLLAAGAMSYAIARSRRQSWRKPWIALVYFGVVGLVFLLCLLPRLGNTVVSVVNRSSRTVGVEIGTFDDAWTRSIPGIRAGSSVSLPVLVPGEVGFRVTSGSEVIGEGSVSGGGLVTLRVEPESRLEAEVDVFGWHWRRLATFVD